MLYSHCKSYIAYAVISFKLSTVLWIQAHAERFSVLVYVDSNSHLSAARKPMIHGEFSQERMGVHEKERIVVSLNDIVSAWLRTFV